MRTPCEWRRETANFSVRCGRSAQGADVRSGGDAYDCTTQLIWATAVTVNGKRAAQGGPVQGGNAQEGYRACSKRRATFPDWITLWGATLRRRAVPAISSVVELISLTLQVPEPEKDRPHVFLY